MKTASSPPAIAPATKPAAGSGWLATIQTPRFREAVQKTLPKHLTPDRFTRLAISAATRVPQLAQCDPPTVLGALMRLSALGLEADGHRAHLIPFWNSRRACFECQLVLDYKGLVELALRSGLLASVEAHVVCEHDDFVYELGRVERHRVDFRRPRGEPFAAWACATTKDGHRQFEAMGRDEIEAVRKRSRAKDSGPWMTDWPEMAKKTVFKRLAKYLVLSAEFRDALTAEDEPVTVDVAPATAAPLREPAEPPEAAEALPAPPVPEPEPPAEPAPEPPRGPVLEAVPGHEARRVRSARVLGVRVAEGRSATGKPWRRWTVELEGVGPCSTFGETAGRLAEDLARRGGLADAELVPSRKGRGLDLVALRESDDLPDFGPAPAAEGEVMP